MFNIVATLLPLFLSVFGCLVINPMQHRSGFQTEAKYCSYVDTFSTADIHKYLYLYILNVQCVYSL